MRKRLYTTIATAALTMVMVIPAYAGSWKQDNVGWWYLNDDSTFPAGRWEWIDGNNDGVAESYYFDANGYLVTDTTTADGYQLNADGAWVVSGVVQTKAVAVDASDSLGCDNNSGDYANAEESSKYVVKRIGVTKTRDIEGGKILGAFDLSDIDMHTKDDLYKYQNSKNFEPDFELFCSDSVEIPACVLVQVELDGKTIVKATPVWIDSLEWDYGGFGKNSEKSRYISGRLEWRSYEVDDPEYALELQIQLTGEAKQRAYEIYPDMIVDYSK